MGFLSVVQDSYDIVNVFVIASLKLLCISGLGFIFGIYRLLLLIVKSTLLSPSFVYRMSCFLSDVHNPSSNQGPLFIFLNDLQNQKIYSRSRCPLINLLLVSVWLLVGTCFKDELLIAFRFSSIISKCFNMSPSLFVINSTIVETGLTILSCSFSVRADVENLES